MLRLYLWVTLLNSSLSMTRDSCYLRMIAMKINAIMARLDVKKSKVIKGASSAFIVSRDLNM